MKKVLLLLLCALVSALSAQAQRLIPGQKGVELLFAQPVIKGERPFAPGCYGMGVALTRYMKRGNYGFVLFGYERQELPYKNYRLPLSDAFLELGYMEQLVCDRGRNIFAYAGFSALGGYEELNKGKALLDNGATLLDGSGPVYGGGVHLSLECFLTDRILLVLKGHGRVLWGTDVHHFRPAVSAGLRFQL